MSHWISEGVLWLCGLIMQGTPPAPVEHPEVLKIRLQAVRLGYAEYYSGENDVIYFRWKLPAEFDTGRSK